MSVIKDYTERVSTRNAGKLGTVRGDLAEQRDRAASAFFGKKIKKAGACCPDALPVRPFQKANDGKLSIAGG